MCVCAVGSRRLQVTYENLTHTIPIHTATQHKIVSVSSIVGDLVTCSALRSRLAHHRSKHDEDAKPRIHHFPVLSSVTGILRPGTMTLILAPPGHSKTALLKAISDKTEASGKHISGSVFYSGYTPAAAAARGIHVHRLTTYAPQNDENFAELTVKETLEFAAATLRAVSAPHTASSVC